MQVEEESPKQYVDIARAPDKECAPSGRLPTAGRTPATMARNGKAVAQRPVPPGCGQDGRLLRYPPRPYRHMAFVGRLAYGPSWPQRITGAIESAVNTCMEQLGSGDKK